MPKNHLLSSVPPNHQNMSFARKCKLTSPRKAAERRTEKKGSMALIVWVKETATLPKLMLVNKLPNVCTHASGKIANSCSQATKQCPTKNKHTPHPTIKNLPCKTMNLTLLLKDEINPSNNEEPKTDAFGGYC